MNHNQIKIAIALKKDYQCLTTEYWEKESMCAIFPPDFDPKDMKPCLPVEFAHVNLLAVPDWTNDMNTAWKLVEEMGQEHNVIITTGSLPIVFEEYRGHTRIRVENGGLTPVVSLRSKLNTEAAICLAWLALNDVITTGEANGD